MKRLDDQVIQCLISKEKMKKIALLVISACCIGALQAQMPIENPFKKKNKENSTEKNTSTVPTEAQGNVIEDAYGWSGKFYVWDKAGDPKKKKIQHVILQTHLAPGGGWEYYIKDGKDSVYIGEIEKATLAYWNQGYVFFKANRSALFWLDEYRRDVGYGSIIQVNDSVFFASNASPSDDVAAEGTNDLDRGIVFSKSMSGFDLLDTRQEVSDVAKKDKTTNDIAFKKVQSAKNELPKPSSVKELQTAQIRTLAKDGIQKNMLDKYLPGEKIIYAYTTSEEWSPMYNKTTGALSGTCIWVACVGKRTDGSYYYLNARIERKSTGSGFSDTPIFDNVQTTSWELSESEALKFQNQFK